MIKTGSRAVRQYKAGHQAAYAQNPVEFNALFQGIAQEIETRIEGKISTIRATAGKRRVHDFAEKTLAKLQGEFSSFPAFLKMVRTYSTDSEEITGLMRGSKWEQKWLKRMATLYRGMKPKIKALSLDKRLGLKEETP